MYMLGGDRLQESDCLIQLNPPSRETDHYTRSQQRLNFSTTMYIIIHIAACQCWSLGAVVLAGPDALGQQQIAKAL